MDQIKTLKELFQREEPKAIFGHLGVFQTGIRYIVLNIEPGLDRDWAFCGRFTTLFAANELARALLLRETRN